MMARSSSEGRAARLGMREQGSCRGLLEPVVWVRNRARRERDEACETNRALHRRVQEAEANAGREAAKWRERHDILAHRMCDARAWVEAHALVTDWYTVPGSPFWPMTSIANRVALSELVHECDEACAERDQLRTELALSAAKEKGDV